jgi:predicted dehydrogenase
MISAAVIGLGRIGAANDYVTGTVPRSHVGALLSGDFRVCALVDPSAEARAAAISHWPDLASTPVVATLSELKRLAADVIVLATPPQDRLGQIAAALELGPKVLVVEKPFANSTCEAEDIVRIAEESGCAVRINFHRRLDAAHIAAKAEMQKAGAPVKVVMSYSKGLLNYGSHLVDFLIDWFGPIAKVEAFGALDAQNPSFCCHMNAGFEAVVIGMDGLAFDEFEIVISATQKRLSFYSGGIERYLRTAVPDRMYPGYVQLGAPELLAPPAQVAGLAELYSAIGAYLKDGISLPGCTPTDALHGMAVLDAVFQSIKNGGRAVSLRAHTVQQENV